MSKITAFRPERHDDAEVCDYDLQQMSCPGNKTFCFSTWTLMGPCFGCVCVQQKEVNTKMK